MDGTRTHLLWLVKPITVNRRPDLSFSDRPIVPSREEKTGKSGRSVPLPGRGRTTLIVSTGGGIRTHMSYNGHRFLRPARLPDSATPVKAGRRRHEEKADEIR